MHVLIVEDDAETRDLLGAMLEKWGHTSCWASSGEAALRLLDTEPVELVLLDLTLEGKMDGWDVARHKFMSPDLARIPFVVVSGMASARIHQLATTNVLEGAIVILGKPVNMEVLERVIDSVSSKG